MKIGIIGAGFVSRTIAALAIQSGHQVMVSNSRGPQTLFSLRALVGCEIGTVDEAAGFGEVAVIAVPLSAYRAVPVDPLAGKIVIDTDNYYPERDGHIPALDRHETTTSALLAAHLPRSRIVKAFNAVRMTDLERDGRPAGSSERLALPLAGDDSQAKAIAVQLYEEFGFDPVDAGALSEGWRFENGTPAYCARLNKKDLKNALAAAVRMTQ